MVDEVSSTASPAPATEPTQGVAFADKVEGTVVPASNLTTTASIEQDNVVKSPSPNEPSTPPAQAPSAVGTSEAAGAGGSLLDPNVPMSSTHAVLGAKQHVSLLATLVHNAAGAATVPVRAAEKLLEELALFIKQI